MKKVEFEYNERYQNLYQNAQVGFYRSRISDGKILDANRRFAQIFGYDNIKELSERVSTVQLYADPDVRKKMLEELRQNGEVMKFDACFLKKDGSTCWARYTARYAGEDSIEGVLIDITEEKQAEEKIKKLSQAVEQTSSLIIITDAEGIIEYVNPTVSQVTGYAPYELIGKKPDIFKSGKMDDQQYKVLWETITSGKEWHGEFCNKKKSGEFYWEAASISPIKDENGVITHFVAVKEDITERKNMEEKLRRQAYYDALTGLLNRRAFEDSLRSTLSHAQRNRQKFCVMFMDLDRFKLINDTLGHQAGDVLLKEVAERLKSILRQDDIIARLGGDEFTILLTDIKNSQTAAKVAKKVLELFKASFSINGHEFYITASIGICIYPSDGEDVQTLMKNADAAMYRSKELGRNGYQFYKTEMNERAVEMLEYEKEFRIALQQDEFKLFYQPQLELETGKIVGLEALVRWNHPDKGVLKPREFLRFIEDSSLIVSLIEKILQTVHRQSRQWQQKGFASLCVHINLSAFSFYLLNIDEIVSNVIKNSETEPCHLGLEIGEEMILKDFEHSFAALQRLREMGIHLTIDDFGVGYSSLMNLRQLPVSTLKIDKSFTRNIPDNPDDAAVAAAIITLAHSLKYKVIVEGVEDQKQLEFLKMQQCEMIQGYLVSKPLSAQDFENFMIQHENLFVNRISAVTYREI